MKNVSTKTRIQWKRMETSRNRWKLVRNGCKQVEAIEKLWQSKGQNLRPNENC